MKKLKKLFIIFIILISIKSYGVKLDTLDYWHVYLNEKVLSKYNSVSKDLVINIDKSKIKENDTISIRYGSDTRCVNCKYILFVRDEKKHKLRVTETKNYWNKLSFGLKDLIEFGQKNKSKRYDFYYWERDENGTNSPMILVLQMKIE